MTLYADLMALLAALLAPLPAVLLWLTISLILYGWIRRYLWRWAFGPTARTTPPRPSETSAVCDATRPDADRAPSHQCSSRGSAWPWSAFRWRA